MLILFDIWLRQNNFSRYAFAKRYKISQPFLSQLINEKKRASPEMVDYLKAITGLKRKDLNPELYGAEEC